MTPVYRVEKVLPEDGKLLLDHLPFHPGQTVEVIVLSTHSTSPMPSSLRGSVIQYDRPTEPVSEADWSVLQ